MFMSSLRRFPLFLDSALNDRPWVGALPRSGLNGSQFEVVLLRGVHGILLPCTYRVKYPVHSFSAVRL